ncbi:hypothetical protein AaE_007746 [Aphanomyces astaci]|uniref:Helicase XPB/Ssl2 N-terminal domain-containing protein n=1 Tax=Aphanomyces astaci TaxID=112090 RepID=A0A6A5ACU3_APHAT|nr:hypothetical protein AaE_007746 [Aphanomyces astaci]
MSTSSTRVPKKRTLAEDYGGGVDEDLQAYVDDDNDPTQSSDAVMASNKLSQRIQKRLTTLESDSGNSQYQDFSSLKMKNDHASRPVWVCPNGRIFLEAFSPLYKQAYDFLVAISEPVSRPEFLHEYKLTPYSLYAAVSVSIETESIVKVLERLSKNHLPLVIVQFIKECTASYGKAKLVLHHNEYYVESLYPKVLKRLLEEESIRLARVKEDILGAGAASTYNATGEFLQKEISAEDQANKQYEQLLMEDYDQTEDQQRAKAAAAATTVQTVSFRIRKTHVEQVKRACLGMCFVVEERFAYQYQVNASRQCRKCLNDVTCDIDFPLMEEYDFRNDKSIPDIDMDLKPTTRIREYQEKSLSKMFGNGRARSGIIVLPCGAGKTLTGTFSFPDEMDVDAHVGRGHGGVDDQKVMFVSVYVGRVGGAVDGAI